MTVAADHMRTLPHAGTFIAIVVLYLVAVAAMALTPLGVWTAETGTIHIVAMLFVALTVQRLTELRKMFLKDFRSFFRFLIAAMLLLGLAHVFEYFADELGIGHDVEPFIVGAIYLSATLTVVWASAVLAREQNVKAPDVGGPLMVLAALYASTFAISDALHAEEGTLASYVASVVALALLGVAVIWTVGRLGRVGKRLGVLARLSHFFQIGVILIWCAFAVESSFALLENAGVAEHQIENLAHYPFYAGMLLMYYAFDLPHHFGGLYADVREGVKSGIVKIEEEPEEKKEEISTATW